MAYLYVLDIEFREGKVSETGPLRTKIRQIFRERYGADLELFAPLTGNVHRLLAIFRFATLADVERLLSAPAEDGELLALEREFHDLMSRPIYHLYEAIP